MVFEARFNQERVAEQIEDENKIRQVEAFLAEMLEDPQQLGGGETAKVLTFNDQEKQDLCIKLITHPEKADIPIEQEFQLQCNAVASGARVPRPIITVSEREQAFIVMERIRGHSVKDIIEKKLSLPPAFDLEPFILALKQEVKKLHREDIYHRDLHLGNIMIEDETGAPVIIDFGSAKENIFTDQDPYRDQRLGGRETLYEADEEGIKKCRKEISRYLTETA